MNKNVDRATVAGFGDEWKKFPQGIPDESTEKAFQDYFNIFLSELSHGKSICLDVGCGSGRWAEKVSELVSEIHLLDASAEALNVAHSNLEKKEISNTKYINSNINDYRPNFLYDSAYSLGVLHHIPDTAEGVRHIASLLKPGAPFLLYLYYDFDNRPYWYKFIWQITNIVRYIICRMPFFIRHIICDLIAVFIYLPISFIIKIADKIRIPIQNMPLSYYRDKNFYMMRTDALDRFGTKLERRFSRKSIASMLDSCGFEGVRFSDRPPFWTSVSYRRR